MAKSRESMPVTAATPKYEYLVCITEPVSGLVIGYYVTKFAFNGRDSKHQEQRGWNFVQDGLNRKSIESGLNHEVHFWGREGDSAKYAKERGISIDS